jgi:hypothetical protein
LEIKEMRTFLGVVVTLILASPAISGELIVTQSEKRGGASPVSLDVISEGDVSAMEFAIELPKGVKSVDTSKCLAELPDSHRGICQASIEAGRLAVVLWSDQNTPLPKGAVSIGRLGLDFGASGEARSGRLKVVGLEMSGTKSQSVAAQATVSSGQADARRPEQQR